MGYLNLDVVDIPGVDVVWNLEITPYPFKDNQFEEVVANHVLEHLSDLVSVVDELHRVCKPGDLIKVRVPYFASPEHHNDPTHKRKFTYKTFNYFTKESIYNYYAKARIEIVDRRILFLSTDSEFMKSKYFLPLDYIFTKFHLIYQRFFSYLLPASEIHFLLRVIK